MSPPSERSSNEAGVRPLLAAPRFEVLPIDNVEDDLDHLPAGATVAVTASPTLGLGATIETAEVAAARGFDVVPHLAARSVRDAGHLRSIVDRLAAAGVTDVFVPGGDREEPVGAYDSAHALLVAMEELGRGFEDVGITGYPEGHPFLAGETLAGAMERKRPHATYLATQLCFDPATVLEWVEGIRERGVDLPVHVGVPGVLDYRRLLGIARRVGVGDSVRFLGRTAGLWGWLRRLLHARGTFAPDDLVEGLAAHADDPAHGIAGLHVYTFNEVADTEAWRTDVLEQHR